MSGVLHCCSKHHLPQILKIVDTAIFDSIISERAYKNNEPDIK